MPTNTEFSRVNLANSRPNFQGQRDNAQGTVSGQCERVDTANANDPTADIPATTWRPDQRPEELLDEQSRQVNESIRAKQDLEQAYGLNSAVAGDGVHAWLRDQHSYGNEQPGGNNTQIPNTSGERK